jgi:hypothetical protein
MECSGAFLSTMIVSVASSELVEETLANRNALKAGEGK